MPGQYNKRRKTEAPYSQPLYRKKKRYSMGYGSRKYYKSVARTRGALFASPEIKYFEFSSNGFITVPTANATNMGTSVTTVPLTSGCCFAPTLGNDITNRIGRKVAVKKISIRGTFAVTAVVNDLVADDINVVRYVLFIDKQANATQATLNDVFVTNAAWVSTIQSIKARQNLATLGRFKILKDKSIMLQNPNIGEDFANANHIIKNGYGRDFKITYRFKKPLIVDFNATNGGTYADIVNNCIQFIAVRNNAVTAVSVGYVGRVSFEDV